MKLFIITIVALVALILPTSALPSVFASVGKPVCGGSSSSKNILLQTPNVPPRECVYQIEATSKYVCQLRIDLKYTLAQPSLPGKENKLRYATCDLDYFQVGNVKLCGEESSQHIYVPFNRTDGIKTLDMRVVLANRVGYHDLPIPSWSMQITQLECPAGASIRSLPQSRSATNLDGYLVAPPGCLQYFPNPSGVVTSFNYNNGNGPYPGKMNYAICFRRLATTKSLKLTASFFQLGSTPKDQKTDAGCYGGFGMNTDYLMVPQGEIKRQFEQVTYLCGDSMKGQEVVSSNPGPLLVLFNSNDLYKNEKGFSLKYTVES